ncbi:hypothetical protein ACHAXS_001078 [Conticribra weissflogii]
MYTDAISVLDLVLCSLIHCIVTPQIVFTTAPLKVDYHLVLITSWSPSLPKGNHLK